MAPAAITRYKASLGANLDRKACLAIDQGPQLILRSHEHAYLVWLGSARIGSKRRTIHTSYGSLIWPGNLSASYETLI